MSDDTEVMDALVKDWLEWVNAFCKRETDVCFTCGKQVTKLTQVGRCVYASCGCRQFQGTVPDAWREQK